MIEAMLQAVFGMGADAAGSAVFKNDLGFCGRVF
jgi:hypothetical protein